MEQNRKRIYLCVFVFVLLCAPVISFLCRFEDAESPLLDQVNWNSSEITGAGGAEAG